MSDVDEENVRRVLAVLERADEPLSLGRIQRRAASEGRDIARSVVREVCERLVEAGEVERVGDPPRERYRPA
jgi:Fe2+ or Zn2+ uptake regulation protein